jgi:hypothetical protein
VSAFAPKAMIRVCLNSALADVQFCSDPYNLRTPQAIDFEGHEMVPAVRGYLPGKYQGVCAILRTPLILLTERKTAFGG